MDKVDVDRLIERWQKVIDNEQEFYGWHYCVGMKRCLSDLKYIGRTPSGIGQC